MSITEDERFHLHQGLIEILGRERAATMMAMLPPVGWADVATKRDLEQLADRFDARFEQVEARFESRFQQLSDRFDARFERELRQLEHRFLNRIVVLGGLFFTAQTAVFQLLR